MARRSLEDTLAVLQGIRRDPLAPSSLAELRRVLAREGNHAVARAAVIAREFEIDALVPDLVQAFERFMARPDGEDKGCVAKAALAEALQRMGHDDASLFLKGLHHVQREPTFGGSVDTAAGLRGFCAFGLAQMHHPAMMLEMAHLLTDPEPAARAAAARALAQDGRAVGVPLLRLKTLVGDTESQVVGECLSALLRLDPAGSLDFVAGFLQSHSVRVAEEAALALGGSRLPEALAPLRAWCDQTMHTKRRATALVAIALLRRDEAFDYLLSLVREGPAKHARDAVAALGTFRSDEDLRRRVHEAASARCEVDLSEAVAQAFG